MCVRLVIVPKKGSEIAFEDVPVPVTGTTLKSILRASREVSHAKGNTYKAGNFPIDPSILVQDKTTIRVIQ